MAIGPIDYSSQVQTPFAAAAQGYQLGATIRADQQAQLAAQQQQAAQMQMQRDLAALASNRNATGADYAQVMTRYPSIAENLTKSWTALNADQQQSTLSTRGQIFAALKSGNPDVAEELLTQSAQAKRRAGLEKDAAADDVMAKMVRLHPETALTSAGLWLAGVPGGEKILAGASTIGTEQRAADKAPAELAKAEADARIAGVAAGNAPTKTALENENAAEDAETKRAQRDIAALNTQIGQANSETQRGELVLRRDELMGKQAEKQQAKSQAAQDQRVALSQAQDTLNKIKAHPAIDGFFTGAGTFGGKQLAMIPGTDRKELNALIDTFKSQQFLSALAKLKEGGPSGLGGLTEAEGDRLINAIGKLDPDMKPAAFKNAIGVIEKTLNDAQSRLTSTGSAPTQGGAVIEAHPKFGNVTEGDINKLLAKNPGATRAQVLQFLQSTGGKTAGGATGPY